MHLGQHLESGHFFVLAAGQDHALDDGQPFPQELMLGPAQTHALGPEVPSLLRVGGIVGVGPHRHRARAELVGPAEHGVHFGRHVALGKVDGSEEDVTGRTVEADRVALGDDDGADREVIGGDVDHPGSTDRRLAPPPGHHGRVAGQAPTRGEDPLGYRHAVYVLGRGLVLHEDHVVTLVVGLHGRIGTEVHLADGGPRRCAQTGRQNRPPTFDLRMQELIQVISGDQQQRVPAVETEIVVAGGGHRDRDRSPPRSVPRRPLEQPELVVLDRELDRHHVAERLLQRRERGHEPLTGDREAFGHLRDGHGRLTAADVEALGPDEELTVDSPLTRRRVAAECQPGAGTLVAVAEHHLLDADGHAAVVVDAFPSAVVAGGRCIPGSARGADGTPQLLFGILRERLTGVRLDHGVETLDHQAQHLDRHLGVVGDAGQELRPVPTMLEQLAGHPEHDRRVHLDQASVGVESEPLVAGGGGETGDRDLVEADVEHAP